MGAVEKIRKERFAALARGEEVDFRRWLELCPESERLGKKARQRLAEMLAKIRRGELLYEQIKLAKTTSMNIVYIFLAHDGVAAQREAQAASK